MTNFIKLVLAIIVAVFVLGFIFRVLFYVGMVALGALAIMYVYRRLSGN